MQRCISPVPWTFSPFCPCSFQLLWSGDYCPSLQPYTLPFGTFFQFPFVHQAPYISTSPNPVHSSHFSFIAISFRKFFLILPATHFALPSLSLSPYLSVSLRSNDSYTFSSWKHFSEYLSLLLECKLFPVREQCVLLIAESPVLTVLFICWVSTFVAQSPRGQGAWLNSVPALKFSLFPLFSFLYLSQEKTRREMRMRREIHGWCVSAYVLYVW